MNTEPNDAMKTKPNFCHLAIYLAAITSPCVAFASVTLYGDHTIAVQDSPAEEGNLTINGTLLTIGSNTTLGGVNLQYDDASSTALISLINNHATAADWVWGHSDGGTGSTHQMSLDTDNILTLHAAVAADDITIDPDAGEILIGAGNRVITGSNAGTLLAASFVARSENNEGSSSSLLLDGTFDAGATNIPYEGGDTRLMWYSERAALRAGNPGGTAAIWNEENVGDYSVALGYGSGAFGVNSTGLSGGLANGDDSVALAGGVTYSGADNALAAGFSQWGGGSSKAMAPGTVAFVGASAVAWNSFAVGDLAVANGQGSVAIGEYSHAWGLDSLAMLGGDASGFLSTAIGYPVSVNNMGSIAVGSGNEDRHGSDLVAARNDWQGDGEHSVFEIGIGGWYGPGKNALTVLQNGAVEVGKATEDDDHVPLTINADGTIIIAKPQGDISMGIYN